MRDVAIVGYLRSALSRSRPKDPGRDWFHAIRSDDLLAKLMPEVAKQAGVDPKEIDDFIVGAAQGVTEQWSYGGRQPLFLANFPETVAAKFVDQQCASAMAATHVGYMEIATDNADVVMTGGMEHMTRVPMGGAGGIVPNMALFTEEKYKHWEMGVAMNMGLTAEKLAKMSGKFSREDMEKFAVRSHQLAAEGQQSGFFGGEILPIEAPQADGSTMVVDKDQAVRGDTTLEGLAGLRTVYDPNGVITAGTSSPLNAGATCMLLMAKELADKKGIKPLATIKGISFAGVDPTVMGVGPVPACQKLLKKTGLKVSDIDYWEINEAFVIVALHCAAELGIDLNKVNIHGGGTAIGHPLGSTGIRLIGTLARILEEKNAKRGIATLCIGGGQGAATLIER